MSDNEGRFTGSVVLVSGASQGIGRAIAQRFSSEGATVAINDIVRNSAMDNLAKELHGVPAPADVCDGDQVRHMTAQIENAVGDVSILVCNAAYMSMSPLLEHSPSDWWKIIDTNLTGTFHLVQSVLPGMRRLGGGRIVIVSSYWGVVGWPNATAYSASKAGLISLTKTLGRELAPEGILVNAIAPGVIATSQLEVDAKDAGVDLSTIEQRYASSVPLGRIGHPEEIAAAAAFLADPCLGSMVGQVLHVNGGEIRCRA